MIVIKAPAVSERESLSAGLDPALMAEFWQAQADHAERLAAERAELTADLTTFLRGLADAVERGDVEPTDVRQALFEGDAYTVDCPISEAAGTGRPENREHAAMLDALDELAASLSEPYR